MSHLDDGTLRQLIDEPAGVAAPDRAHAESCAQCGARRAALAADAAAVQAALTEPATQPANAAAALAAVRARTSRPAIMRPAWPAHPWAGVAAAAAVVAFAFLVAATPLRTVAAGFLAIFEPSQIVAVPVTRADIASLRALPDLEAYGTVREGPQPVRATVADPRSAALIAGMPVRVAAFVPPAFPAKATYYVMGRTSGTFTFSAAKAAAAATAHGTALPPMPGRLDGSTLVAAIGPVVLARYGTLPTREDLMRAKHGAVRALHTSVLVVAQAAAPRVSSNGASVREIESYLLSMPGIPPQLAAEIRMIGDPETTLPIPIEVDRQTAERVMVQGVPGLGIMDNTGLGSGVVWQRNGTIYAVAGALPAADVLAVANSLR